MTAPKPEDVEIVLKHLHPGKGLFDLAGAGLKGLSTAKGIPDLSEQILGQTPEGRNLQDTRQRLLAMPAEKVARLAVQAKAEQAARSRANAAALEAARFYNQANAHADFEHWCKADNWTLDEAVALLLAKDPDVVNPQAFERESSADLGLVFIKKNKAAPPTGFARTYQRLRTLIERADALTGPRLKPWAVIEWARRTMAVDVPEPLARMAPPAGPSPSNEVAPPEVGAALPQPKESPAVQPARQDGITPTKWTDELKAELAAYRQVHGTKAAAAYFRIAESRVRALLPKQAPAPAGYSAFNTHRMK